MKSAPLKYRCWERRDEMRWDLVLMGEPDCHAYIVRYPPVSIYGPAWCWTLTMPRASSNRRNGWASSAPVAKRQVEAAIAEGWA